MKLKFNDGSVRDLPDNPRLAARLIHISQQRGGTDYKVEIDERIPTEQKKQQLSDIQHYIDWYRLQTKRGREF